MKIGRIFLRVAAVLVLTGLASAAVIGWRAYRLFSISQGFEAQIRYLLETGENIGEKPASEAFSTDYLEAIFGDNPDLLDRLKVVVQKGITEEPDLNLGDVTAMIVTYHKTKEDQIVDVVAHAMGGFPAGKRRLGFHQDGFFSGQLDNNLWNAGNLVISFLGRDMVMFSEESIAEQHQAYLQEIFNGEILPFAETLANPMYFTAVLPDPKRLVPPQLRQHIQAVVLKGMLAYDKGSFETILLCSSHRSADYALAITTDMKTMAGLTLKNRFGGVVRETEWGPIVDTWWALEMAKALEDSKLAQEQVLVRFRSEFDRVMVNAVLKTIERMGRDLALIRTTINDGRDPRMVAAEDRQKSGAGYWSKEHQWGPNWPIPDFEQQNTNEVSTVPFGTNVPAANAGT